MRQRGRKSTAKLTLIAGTDAADGADVVALPGQRPEPPPELTDAEAAIWRHVSATKPADWFAGAHHLLAEYCVSAAFAQQLTAEIHALRPVPEDDLDVRAVKAALRSDLAKHRDRQHAAMVALARSLRVSPASRYRGEVAKTAHDKVAAAGGAKKPWET